MFYDLIKNRRSIRKFQNKEVEQEKIDIILKSALMSPSSRGRKPWELIVVTDKDILKKLSICKGHGSSFLADAPLGIVVIADPEICDVWVEDASIASSFIQLAAQSLGLGSCWIQARERYTVDNSDVKVGDYIKEILNIPGKYEVECMIAIGYPAENKKPYDENQLAYEKIHYGKY